MGAMENTTISVSKKFRDWLKSKGSKGESYEDIIRKMLKQEHREEVSYDESDKPDDSSENQDLL